MWPVPERASLERSDKELMKLAAEGDSEAFDELMRRHEKALVRWVWALLGDPDEAQDVAQDAFLQALYPHADAAHPIALHDLQGLVRERIG